MNRKIVAIIVVLLLVVVGIFAWQAVQEEVEVDDENGEEIQVVTLNLTAEGREFYLEGEDEENPDLVVNEGDEVLIEIEVTGGTHDFVIDEFDVATEELGEGEIDYVEFTADQVGEFEYYCSRGTHREDGMYGNFIVEEVEEDEEE